MSENEMVERVRREIGAVLFDKYGIILSPDTSLVARAAIEAMREPTRQMCEEGEEADFLDWSLEPGEGLDGFNMANAWRAMIDAALRST